MKAFILDRYGKKAPLRLGEAPEPELRDNDILVEVYAAALNLLDSKIRDGEFKSILPYRPPFVLGHDVAGKVIRVGAQVDNQGRDCADYSSFQLCDQLTLWKDALMADQVALAPHDVLGRHHRVGELIEPHERGNVCARRFAHDDVGRT